LLQKLEVIEMCCTVITFEDLKMLSDIYILLVGDTEIFIVKKVCRKYAERKSLIPTFEMRTLKLKRSTQYCRLMAMRTIVGKPLDSTNNPRI
jgi:hypothetical protein